MVSLRLPGCVCRTYGSFLAKYNMYISHIEGPLKAYEDDYRRMRSSNDLKVDKIVDLSFLGVVDLDTSIVPDVFGIRAFDAQEPVACVLPGDFRNWVCVLVPDAAATPMDFHDIVLEELSSMLDSRTRLIVRSDVTSLKRRWPSVLFQTMHKRQADMECLRRAYVANIQEEDSKEQLWITVKSFIQ